MSAGDTPVVFDIFFFFWVGGGLLLLCGGRGLFAGGEAVCKCGSGEFMGWRGIKLMTEGLNKTLMRDVEGYKVKRWRTGDNGGSFGVCDSRWLDSGNL